MPKGSNMPRLRGCERQKRGAQGQQRTAPSPVFSVQREETPQGNSMLRLRGFYRREEMPKSVDVLRRKAVRTAKKKCPRATRVIVLEIIPLH